jgi:hypothetical protein
MAGPVVMNRAASPGMSWLLSPSRRVASPLAGVLVLGRRSVRPGLAGLVLTARPIQCIHVAKSNIVQPTGMAGDLSSVYPKPVATWALEQTRSGERRA